ncbi:granzyme B(G,H)-like [Pholidichthys leucotaenia]
MPICKAATLVLVLTLCDQVYMGKIIGGHETVPHSRPYMALLERHMPDNSKAYCGGFLLNKDFVMTAAHCKAESYTVLLGLHNFHKRQDVQQITVTETFPHKYYNQSNFKNDLMILKLSSKANFSQNVRPIPIADQDDGSLPKSCIIAGWGRFAANSPYMSPKLMEANVTLIDDEMCVELNEYCATGQTGPAEGDSGGPLVCEDEKAYGVISNDFIPVSGGPPIHRFTKISEIRSWIISTIRQPGHANQTL